MATITKFEDIETWQLARIQVQNVFTVINQEPFIRDFGLRNQINSSSGSVMDNIAEGFDRSVNKEFINFLFIAKGSNGETRSQLYRAFYRNYIDHELYETLRIKNETLGSKIMAFIKYLKASEFKGQYFK